MSTTKYPTWVPEVIRQLHDTEAKKDQQQGASSSNFLRLLTALAGQSGRADHDTDAEIIWESLDKLGEAPYQFFFTVLHASFGPSNWEMLRKSQRTTQAGKIAGLASKLAEAIKDSPFDRSAYRYYGDTEAEVMLSLLDKNFVPEERRPDESSSAFLDAILSWPTLTNTLHNLAMSARIEALKNPYNVPSVVEEPLLLNPGAKNADRDFFIRRMSQHFQRLHHDTLHNTVAAVARIRFNDPEITSDVVRSVVNRLKRKKSN